MLMMVALKTLATDRPAGSGGESIICLAASGDMLGYKRGKTIVSQLDCRLSRWYTFAR